MSNIVAKFTVPREKSVDLTNKLSVLLPEPQVEGKTFKGWYTIDNKNADSLTADDIKDYVFVFAKYE